jgi:uncharacterized membrane protein
MTLLILGLILWYVSHLLKRFAPAMRAAMGEQRGKGFVAILALIAVVLMVIGYRGAEVVPVYAPLAGMGHLNNLMMLVSVFLFGAANNKGLVRMRLRHPMLTGTIVWAVAHLLVNGDVASLVLFGGLGVWAVVSMLAINAQTVWNPPAVGTLRSDLIVAVASVVLFGIIAWIHILLGHNPFLGTYP